jgi:hypothetical protein
MYPILFVSSLAHGEEIFHTGRVKVDSSQLGRKW